MLIDRALAFLQALRKSPYLRYQFVEGAFSNQECVLAGLSKHMCLRLIEDELRQFNRPC